MPQPAIEELDLRPGDHYDQFEIIRPLGRGSYARVFAARHPAYADPIALKLSRTPLTSETTAIRALREIRALQSLHNPHVVHIYDHGVGSDERWFMVMELLEGRNLLEHHDFDVPMPPAEAIHLIYQACVGLDEAHRQGIVHRDVKPENLWILTKNGALTGRLKVIDFGLARAWDPSVTVGEQATVGHMLIGTPHYAQPEQVHTGALSPASDVYSLGIVLYELLTGRVPFFPNESWARVVLRLASKPVHWLGAHVKSEPTPIGEHPAALTFSPALRSIVHAMIAKEPGHRPATGGDAARLLAAVLLDDYGISVAARLLIQGAEAQFLVPGSYTIGEQTGAIALRGIGGAAPWGEARVVAKLEWLGPGNDAMLTPVEPGICRVDGRPTERPVRIPAGAQLEFGAVRVRLEYPQPIWPS
jgi:serine/threonine protein kinase